MNTAQSTRPAPFAPFLVGTSPSGVEYVAYQAADVPVLRVSLALHRARFEKRSLATVQRLRALLRRVARESRN